MPAVDEQIRLELQELINDSESLWLLLSKKNTDVLIEADFVTKYQTWYSRALPIVAQIMPDRYKEFQYLYENPKGASIKEVLVDIRDFTMNIRMEFGLGLFEQQKAILQSLIYRMASSLSNIRGVLQAELFDTELDSAEELLKNGHFRSAGVLAGVTLEGHLAKVCDNHGIQITKKGPSISDYNEALKDSILEVSQWRFIQHLNDLRNKCAHKRTDEPTKDDAKDLIEGVKKIIKTVF